MLKHKIMEIRPKVIFQKVEQSFPDENVMFNVSIPASGIGGLTLLESSILTSLVKLFNPKELFEFGTYLGATSLLLATNTAADAIITTLDLPAEDIHPQTKITEAECLSNDYINDNYLRNNFLSTGSPYIDRTNKLIRNKIHRTYQNSLELNIDSNRFRKKFDFIFIDGGHDYETVKSDTNKSIDMLKDDAVLLWHDYRSELHTDVTTFVDRFSQNHKTIYVQNTMLAFHACGKYADLI